ncbi:MAG: type III pantothenate kinase [Campylobacterota bacterium]|nr:type III pantothenate kinase [Campylobacterota bacterium]
MMLCDIGNSTFHFKIKKKDFKISVDKKIKYLPKIKGDIYFISVNQNGTKKFLKRYPDAIDLSKFLSLKTQYVGMGIDRKLVCEYIKDGIIVDFGSAITVDIMDDSVHKGGFISPGISSYKKIYPKISKKLRFDFKNDINLDKIPLKTNDAINYAIFNAIILPILKVYTKYEKRIYFTGEDSNYILKYFDKIDIKYKKNLIFNSMKRIIKKEKIC